MTHPPRPQIIMTDIYAGGKNESPSDLKVVEPEATCPLTLVNRQSLSVKPQMVISIALLSALVCTSRAPIADVSRHHFTVSATPSA